MTTFFQDFAKFQIEASNNKIAKFIEVDIDYSSDVYKDSKSPLRHYINNRKKSEQLLFHSDWNWLMVVVEYINKKDKVTIYSDECIIHSLKSNNFKPIIVVNEGQPIIKSVYEAVVKYIDLYEKI